MTCSDLFPCRFVLFILWWHFYVGRAIVISLCRSHLGPGSVSFSKPQQLHCHIVSADSSNWWTLDEDCDDFCIFSLICKLSPRCVKAAVQVFAACALLFSVGFLVFYLTRRTFTQHRHTQQGFYLCLQHREILITRRHSSNSRFLLK